MTVLNSKAEAKDFVEETIKTNKVVIFSKTFCPFCIKAKKALGELVPAEKILAIELDKRQDIIVIQDALGEITGARTVPRVFIDGKFIGGGDDTATKAANGELKALLESAGVL